MNNTCGKCGGFIGDFTYSGEGAVICNGSMTKHIEEKYPPIQTIKKSEFCIEIDRPLSDKQTQQICAGMDRLIIKIHEEAIKELEGRKKKYTPNFQQTEPYVGGHNQALDEAITYHQKEISKLKT